MLRFCREVSFYKYVNSINDEGSLFSGLDEKENKMIATIYPASNKLYGEIYGQRIENILSVITENKEITINDGIKIDYSIYRVVSIKEYSKHRELLVEKIDD